MNPSWQTGGGTVADQEPTGAPDQPATVELSSRVIPVHPPARRTVGRSTTEPQAAPGQVNPTPKEPEDNDRHGLIEPDEHDQQDRGGPDEADLRNPDEPSNDRRGVAAERDEPGADTTIILVLPSATDRSGRRDRPA